MVNLKGGARPGSVAIADPDSRANLDKKRACMALIRRAVYLVISGPTAHVNER